jgi:hypothetical protein
VEEQPGGAESRHDGMQAATPTRCRQESPPETGGTCPFVSFRRRAGQGRRTHGPAQPPESAGIRVASGRQANIASATEPQSTIFSTNAPSRRNRSISTLREAWLPPLPVPRLQARSQLDLTPRPETGALVLGQNHVSGRIGHGAAWTAGHWSAGCIHFGEWNGPELTSSAGNLGTVGLDRRVGLCTRQSSKLSTTVAVGGSNC